MGVDIIILGLIEENDQILEIFIINISENVIGQILSKIQENPIK